MWCNRCVIRRERLGILKKEISIVSNFSKVELFLKSFPSKVSYYIVMLYFMLMLTRNMFYKESFCIMFQSKALYLKIVCYVCA